MPRLSITARGQLTLRREILRHLGLEPGQKVEASLRPDGAVELKAAPREGSIHAFIGSLKDQTKGRRLSVEEMNEVIADGAADNPR
ncbi:hypothetical protein FP2506_01475 [Fulvimarina pelagi HTCC2506]|uniref:SpoVT-AbrB domain-containing protein n=1 Tax=Fulvimarina pelagi HTCC2506 TaxID=314231 RepID=Q0G202_9HYPH|nr:AbrB/MazE/SpoVT family DNA-binding domain-containing protein [Fulvimarina pelagi]EAU41396.1 hypothetical protein FP2506_01475 [Fulvimarina pelagi HTCC2506]